MNIENIGIACSALKHSGGMERYARDLVQGLYNRNIKPTFFARKFDKTIAEYQQVKPIKLNTSYVPGKLRDYLFAYLLNRQQRTLKTHPLIACIRTARCDIAICGGTHIGFLKACKKKKSFWDKGQILLERKGFDNAKLIVAHSKKMAEELNNFYQISSKKVITLYPPVDTVRFKTINDISRQVLRKKLGWPANKVIFLFPSSSHERKGLPLLQAFFEQTDLPILLAIVGRPPKKIGKNSLYLGYQPNIEKLYQAADFTILAPQYEPFGLVGIESVLCGTHVILAKGMGCSEAILPQAQTLFDANNFESLVNVMNDEVKHALIKLHRIVEPEKCLTYDVSVDTHIEALLKAYALRS